MLDHLSHGRLEVGIGRGVSPFELKYHKVEHEDSRDIFIDAYKCLSAGLTTDTLNYSGPYYKYENVPIALRPLQNPHPAFWYGSSNTIGSTWAGEHGMHFVSLGPTPFAKKNIDAFREALAKRGGPAHPKAEFPGGTAIGVQRHIFVADTDAEAIRFAKPAMELHLAQLNWLRSRHGVTGLTSRLNVPRGATFEDGIADGSVIAGTPQRVYEELERQVSGAWRKLSPHLSLSRQHDAAGRAALARAVLDRGDAEARAALRPHPEERRRRVSKDGGRRRPRGHASRRRLRRLLSMRAACGRVVGPPAAFSFGRIVRDSRPNHAR